MADRDWIRESVARVTAKYQDRNPFVQTSAGTMEFSGPIPSATTPGVMYDVVVKPGYTHCTCKGYQYNHRCSHIKTVQEALDSGGV